MSKRRGLSISRVPPGVTGLTRVRARRRLRALYGRRSPVRSTVLRRPRLATAITITVAAAAALPLTGPVGAVVAGIYASLALGHAMRRRRAALDDTARSLALDAVAGLAADLRAGANPVVAWAAARAAVERVPLIRERTATGWRVADATGAPVADLLDRLQRDLRAVERVRLAATAHAAGIRATAVLLALLPLVGIGLGYGMGGDPLRVLLHTPLGAACAITATLLHLAGFGWAGRLARVVR